MENTTKKRGRKRKAADLLREQEESSSADDSHSPIRQVQSSPPPPKATPERSSQRRRVPLVRYSPPLTITRAKTVPRKSRSYSTSSQQSKYIIDSDESDADNETATTPKVDAPSGSNRRRNKSLDLRNVGNTVNTVKKLEVEKQYNNKMVAKMPDGSQKRITISKLKKPADMSDAVGEISAKKAAAHPNYKPARSSTRRKSTQVVVAANQSQINAAAASTIGAASAMASTSTSATETGTVPATGAERTACFSMSDAVGEISAKKAATDPDYKPARSSTRRKSTQVVAAANQSQANDQHDAAASIISTASVTASTSATETGTVPATGAERTACFSMIDAVGKISAKKAAADPRYKPARSSTRRKSNQVIVAANQSQTNAAAASTTAAANAAASTSTSATKTGTVPTTGAERTIPVANLTTVKLTNQTASTPITATKNANIVAAMSLANKNHIFTPIASKTNLPAPSATASTPATVTTTDAERTVPVSNLTAVKMTDQILTPNTATKTAKSHIARPIASRANLPPILKPAVASTSISSTPLSTLAVKSAAAPTTARRPQPQQSMTKYVSSLPKIGDCLNADGVDDKRMKKLPDRVMLIHSELPLHLAVHVDNPEKEYLFQQIISPVQATPFVCLLCKSLDVNFGVKEEQDILLHYQSLHGLDVDIGHAKFRDETVFICLPKMVLSQLAATTGSQVELDSCCKYCEERLNNVVDMEKHYREEHHKEVFFMEQEEIMKMHHYFYCSKCRKASFDFDSHHHHMKSDHGLKTYRCEFCAFLTQDETRLRTHNVKHMLPPSNQKYNCYYCHGSIIGVEGLMKHIQQSHMVRTGTEFSCIACLQTCGRGKELLTHAQGCTLAGVKPEQRDNKFINVVPDRVTPMAVGEVECYLCSVRLESEEVYQMHLHHEHMKWVGEPSKGPPEGDLGKLLTVDDVISEDNLEKAKIQTYVGHWCRMCDQVIKVYRLYYLHMVNYHRMEKEFQCVITQCKAQFTDFEEFKKHIEETGHSQKTIISHPDEVAVCTYCDIYYPTEEELVSHLITDQHINKFTASRRFDRTEPRNFKCANKTCQAYFGMKESYIHHLEAESHKYICHYCGLTTARPSARRAHIQNTHPEKVNTCEACGEVHQNILDHFVAHGFSFECKKCVKRFYNRERLNAHMEVHKTNTNVQRSQANAVNRGQQQRIINTPNLTNNIIRCEHCGNIFKNTRELNMHQCTEKIATPPSVARNNGQQNKVYELASKASTAPKATNKPAPRIRNLDDDTKLIMIVNQVTGELMEITTPKGMEVRDVIESLNILSMEEGGALAVEHPMDEQGLMVEEGVPQDEQEETVAAIQMINDQSNVDQINEAQELAAAQEANLIAVGQQADGQREETTGEAVDGTTAML